MGLQFPQTCISGHYCPPNSIKPTACLPVSLLQCMLCFYVIIKIKLKHLLMRLAYFDFAYSLFENAVQISMVLPLTNRLTGAYYWQGTYNPNGGTATIASCLPCDAGSFCKRPGLNATEGKCFAGYYCTGGSPSPTPVSGVRVTLAYMWPYLPPDGKTFSFGERVWLHIG